MQHDAVEHRLPIKTGCCVLLAAACCAPHADSQMSSSQQAARAQQVQLSEREQGTVTAQQNAAQGSGSGVSVVQPAVNVSGRFAGSVSDPNQSALSANALVLSYEDAVQRGIRFNLGTVYAENAQRVTRAQRLSALSQILPNINGTLSQTVAQSYLPAIGISSGLLGGMVKIPDVTGQYHFYTLQGTVSEDLLDPTALQNLRSADASGAAAQNTSAHARELVILAVGGSYVQAIATQALITAQREEVRLAEATYKQADNQHRAGTRAALDANRSLVELRTEQLRLSSDEAEFAKQKIRLARLIGLAPATELALTSPLADTPPAPEALAEIIARAYDKRADLKAAEHQMQAAASAQKAARAEYLPSVSISGNYGLQGTTPEVGRVAYQGVASLNIPIWQGGRVKADTAQADAAFDQRRAEYTDQRAQVETEVRTAYVDLTVATEQVKVARDNVVLARDTLKQSTDRFASGVTDSVEVVQSEQTLSSSERDYVSSLYAQTLAQLHLAQASGNAALTLSVTPQKGSN